MSYFEFNIKDYRIIKDAKLEPEGVTLIYGRNGSGKSSLIKSLVTLLSNKHSEDNFRHGTDSYSISAKCGENIITYNRSGSNAQVQFNKDTPKTKLGKGTLAEVEPRFPLKRIDYVDSSFYPNFSFQNSVPVFEEISTSDLFASMFSDVAKISERVTSCRSDVINTSKIKNDSQVGTDILKEKVLEAGKQVDLIKNEYPDLENQYNTLRGLSIKQSNLIKFQAEYNELSTQCSDPTKRVLVSLYSEAQPLFADLVFVDKIRNTLGQLERINTDLDSCKSNSSKLSVEFPVNVVTLISGINQIKTSQSAIESIHKSIEALPDISPDLVYSGSNLISLRNTLSDVKSEFLSMPVIDSSLISEIQELISLEKEYEHINTKLSEVNASYELVMKELKDFPCNRYLDGVCPYQEQIKVGV